MLAPDPPSPDRLSDWRRGVEDGGWLHLNAAGASPSHWTCHEAQVAHLELERSMGGYAAAAKAMGGEGRRDTRASIAALLHCDTSEVALQESAQIGWAKAFYSLDLGPADTIFAFESEYAGNAVAMLQRKERTGASLAVLPLDATGTADLRALRDALSAARDAHPAGLCVIALTHMNTDSAILQPAAAVGELAREWGAVYLLDACQTIGQLEVDVSAIGCDFASGTGRKWLRGPRGAGFLYARRRATDLAEGSGGAGGGARSLFGEPPMLDHVSAAWTSPTAYDLAGGARRFEMWEASQAARLGLGAAAELALALTPQFIHLRSSSLAAELRSRLHGLHGLRWRDGSARAAPGQPLGAIVALEVEGVDSHALARALAARRIGCSVSPSTHSFAQADWARPAALRLSPTYYNTEAEIGTAATAVLEEVARLRATGRAG